MGIRLGIGSLKIGTPFKSASWSSYWNPQKIEAAKPTNLTVVCENDYAKISFTDNSDGKAEHEIYEANDAGSYSLVAALPKGVVSYNNYTYQNASMNFKIRAKGGTFFSTYTDVVNLLTPLVFKVTTTAANESAIIQNMVIADTKTVTIDWGDTNTTDVIGTNNNITHQYVSVGLYYVKFTGDRNFITSLQIYNQTRFSGDLSKWIFPYADNLTGMSFFLYGCLFTGDLTNTVLPKRLQSFVILYGEFTGKLPNKVVGYSDAGLNYNAAGNRFTGLSLNNTKYGPVIFNVGFSKAKIPKTEVNTFLDNLRTFYDSVKANIYGNSSYDLRGYFNGEVEAGQLDQRIVDIQAWFAAKGKTCTFLLNEYSPFPAAKIMIGWDGNILGCYTGAKYLQSIGVKSTVYVTGSTVGDAGCFTSANMQELNSLGIELGCHGWTHTNFTTLSDAALALELEANNTLFASLSLPEPVYCAYPNGYISDAKALIVANYRTHGRAIDAIGRIPNYKNGNKYLISSFIMEDDPTYGPVTQDLLLRYIQEAIEKKCLLVLYGHSYNALNTANNGVRKVDLDYIKQVADANNIDIINHADLEALYI